jgi:hypothetical protein
MPTILLAIIGIIYQAFWSSSDHKIFAINKSLFTKTDIDVKMTEIK